jgi:hypothetical protein
MSLTDKQIKLITYIDQQVKEITSKGGDERTVLASLVPIMDDLKKILRATPKQELNCYCEKYTGFYQFMSMLEALAAGIANGSLRVPQN